MPNYVAVNIFKAAAVGAKDMKMIRGQAMVCVSGYGVTMANRKHSLVLIGVKEKKAR